MNASFLTFLTAGLCTLLVAATLAEAGGRGRMFDRMDQDGDGLVTRSEAEEARGRWFERLDADGDGYLTIEEMSAQRHRDGGEGKAARRERHFARLDRDGDGRIGQSEFAAKSGHWIERIDADGDGAVSREEWRSAAERRKSKGSDPAPQ